MCFLNFPPHTLQHPGSWTCFKMYVSQEGGSLEPQNTGYRQAHWWLAIQALPPGRPQLRGQRDSAAGAPERVGRCTVAWQEEQVSQKTTLSTTFETRASESRHCFIQEQPWERGRCGQQVLGHLRVKQGVCSPSPTVAPRAAPRPALTSGFRNSLDKLSAYLEISLAYAPYLSIPLLGPD